MRDPIAEAWIEQVARAVARGYPVRAALGLVNRSVGDLDQAVRADPAIRAEIERARGKALARRVGLLLTAADRGGVDGRAAAEELAALYRVDWGAQRSPDASPLDRVLDDPGLLAALPVDLRVQVDAAVTALQAAEDALSAWLAAPPPPPAPAPPDAPKAAPGGAGET